MPNAESMPKGISGVLQNGMSPEGSEKQACKGFNGGDDTSDAHEDESESTHHVKEELEDTDEEY